MTQFDKRVLAAFEPTILILIALILAKTHSVPMWLLAIPIFGAVPMSVQIFDRNLSWVNGLACFQVFCGCFLSTLHGQFTGLNFFFVAIYSGVIIVGMNLLGHGMAQELKRKEIAPDATD